jgi:ribonuclease HII
MMCPSCAFEEEAARLGASRIAGIDEVGRGPLAGPVVAAAVVMPYAKPIAELNDSKMLTEEVRERLFEVIRDKALSVGVGHVPPEEIDRINIYQATRLAMSKAVKEISPLPDYLLIDGPLSLDLNIQQRSIIKGDRLCYSVAAASIVAKVIRDRIMLDLHEQYPQYGFASHKGYATRAHLDAIERHGPCSVHRKCFRGVREHLPTPLFG